ncbi:Eukaryotic translation initiation factor 4E type 2 [Collichthys lucidus]|uniref:Eukaryotic translation initiation factor 4E type 2 n=1 Tax=Collichthys lucidus TaxID=240159 RepID=A0A4U5VY63_COLLU|nr:Eukaryotic translation initiation factor 4E type 2 [Collichthys lucidus]
MNQLERPKDEEDQEESDCHHDNSEGTNNNNNNNRRKDDSNRSGGKWIIRLRKGLASRFWENIILAMLGEQFMVGEEICGAVVSIRFQVLLQYYCDTTVKQQQDYCDTFVIPLQY